MIKFNLGPFTNDGEDPIRRISQTFRTGNVVHDLCSQKKIGQDAPMGFVMGRIISGKVESAGSMKKINPQAWKVATKPATYN